MNGSITRLSDNRVKNTEDTQAALLSDFVKFLCAFLPASALRPIKKMSVLRNRFTHRAYLCGVHFLTERSSVVGA